MSVAVAGCLLGTAVGDAMGLACEGLGPRRQRRLFPDLDGYRLLPFRKGMCSDDTEHACMLAQSLIRTAGCAQPDEMARRLAADLAWRLRWWLLGLPAGIGSATLRAILRLWIGIPAERGGVRSAGNGPAMRVALIGVCYGDDAERTRALVRAATRVTHTDPRAEHGALAVAVAARLSAEGADVSPAEYLHRLQALLPAQAELWVLLAQVAASVERNESTQEFASRAGWDNGVGGYMLDTVPAAIHAWLSHQGDFRGAVLDAVRLGGDTDTVAAIVGALAGARSGPEGIPPEWRRDLWEWPRSVEWMHRLARRLDTCIRSRESAPALPLPVAGLALRNAFFLAVVLAHGMRRLLPPYGR